MKEITFVFSVWFTQNILSVKGIYARILDYSLYFYYVVKSKYCPYFTEVYWTYK